ncbi:MAG: hypothetical protein GX383_11510 [Clostridium sp.]|nr:hypothetical protein [Clostridium sp.]
MSSTIAYGNIELKSSFEIIQLKELRIEKKNNEHARVYFTGVVPEDKKDSYIDGSYSNEIIEVVQIDDNSNSTVLFKGIITDVQLKAVRGIYYITVEGASCTYNMDLKLKKRSFQNKDMQYTELIDEVLKDYPGADFIDTAAKGKKLEKVFIQYDETDWEFLKRMASHFNVGLVPDAISDKPKFWFGIPEGGKGGNLEEFNYSVRKKIGDFRYSSENFIDEIDEQDFIYYEIQTDKVFNIGDPIKFNDISLVVNECRAFIEGAVLRHEYVISPKKGLSQELILNEQLFRASEEGKIIEIKEDNVRIHLDIDKEQKKEEAFWFPYSTFYTTEGNTGWYCMPELDDKVKLYFPSNKEEEGIVMNSIRRRTKSGDKIDDPDVKYFRTKFKKEKRFSEKELVFSADDDKVYIKLNEDDGIEIYSKSEIKIEDENDIQIKGDTVDIKAKGNIEIACNQGSIKLDGTTTHIKNSRVKEG